MMSMAYQVLPSPAAMEALDGLHSIIVRELPPQDVGDAFLARDWSALWSRLAQGGWTELADGPSPGRDGDFTLRDLSAIAEEWGGYLVPLPLIETLLARRWSSTRPAAGDRLTYALATLDLRLVPFGEMAKSVLVDHAAEQERIDRASLGAALRVDDFASSLPISQLAGAPSRIRPEPLREICVLNAAACVGAAASVLTRSVDYARTRQQFGRQIGSFQAVKHRLADMHCRVELARSAVTWAAGEPQAAELATRHAVELCLRVAEDGVQVQGGIGYTWESTTHRFLRQIISLRSLVVAASAGMSAP